MTDRKRLTELWGLVEEHWNDNLARARAGREIARDSIRGETCAFCMAFLDDTTDESCDDCPVYQVTGEEYCINTYWGDVHDAVTDADYPQTHEARRNALDAVQAFRDELKEIRAKDEEARSG